jgi:hypothetical protein
VLLQDGNPSFILFFFIADSHMSQCLIIIIFQLNIIISFNGR